MKMLLRIKDFFKNLYHKTVDAVTPVKPPVVVVPVPDDVSAAFVKLDLPTGNSFADWQFVIKEHVDSLPAGPAKDFGNANLFYSNGTYEILGFIPAAKPLLAGVPPRVDGNAPAYLKTNVCPDHDRNGTPFLDTVEKAKAHYAALK